MKKSHKKLTFAAMLAGTAVTASLPNGCAADNTPESPLEGGTYEPSHEIPVDVYGPPEAFKFEEDEPSDVNEPSGEYDPSCEIPVDVYGPPSAF